MIVLKDFFVNNSLMNPTFSGVLILNKTRPTVVSINLFTIVPSASRTFAFTLIQACKSAFPSLFAITTSSAL